MGTDEIISDCKGLNAQSIPASNFKDKLKAGHDIIPPFIPLAHS